LSRASTSAFSADADLPRKKHKLLIIAGRRRLALLEIHKQYSLEKSRENGEKGARTPVVVAVWLNSNQTIRLPPAAALSVAQ
jgi:hypothetical protein